MEIRYGKKRSGVRRDLIKKLGEWLKSIDDENVRTLAERDVIVTGGSIVSMLMGDKINDYDIYFKTKATTKLVAEYYVKQFNDSKTLKTKEGVRPCLPIVREEELVNAKGETENRVVIMIQSAGIAGENQSEYAYFESMSQDALAEFAESIIDDSIPDEDKPKYRPVFMSQNAITLSDKVQIIIRFYGDPKTIHDNFDFVHAMCYWDHKAGDLVLPAEALEAMLSRTLLYRGSLYPIASIFRMKKFIERGWRITAGQQLKIMWQISELNLHDMTMLREQLTGVDMAYMYQLIEALKDVEPEKITASYVAAIIDKVFD